MASVLMLPALPENTSVCTARAEGRDVAKSAAPGDAVGSQAGRCAAPSFEFDGVAVVELQRLVTSSWPSLQ